MEHPGVNSGVNSGNTEMHIWSLEELSGLYTEGQDSLV